MNSDPQRNKLNMPLHPVLMDYIMHEYPQTGPIIVSTVEYTIKESRNHYMDVMRALEPLLKDNTKAFVDKLFMFRKRMCRDGSNCVKYFCLFAHNDEELLGARRTVSEQPVTKRARLGTGEVILSGISDEKKSVEDVKKYSQKYGTVVTVRKIGKSRYVVVFDDLESAKEMVDSKDLVFGDSNIQLRLNPYSGDVKGTEAECLFEEQKELLDRLTETVDSDLFIELKEISKKIRQNVQCSEDEKTSEVESSQYKQEESIADIESSLYYNMFAK